MTTILLAIVLYILQVNGKNIEAYGHDMAVQTLKHAGDEVTLVVKYFKPASLFLNRSKYDVSKRLQSDNVHNYTCIGQVIAKKSYVC